MQEKMKQYLNQEVLYRCGALTVEVKIIDYKITYGRERFLITPIKGSGKQWVEQIIEK